MNYNSRLSITYIWCPRLALDLIGHFYSCHKPLGYVVLNHLVELACDMHVCTKVLKEARRQSVGELGPSAKAAKRGLGGLGGFK